MKNMEFKRVLDFGEGNIVVEAEMSDELTSEEWHEEEGILGIL